MDDSSKKLTLVQQEKIDCLASEFEQEFRAGRKPQIEEYIEKLPELRTFLLKELLAVELELRQEDCDQLDQAEFQNRFPADAKVIAAAFAPFDAPTGTVPHSIETSDTLDEDPTPTRLGRYEVQRVLGRGGCGVVYLAYDPQNEWGKSQVALKVPRQEWYKSPDGATRFMDEARVGVSLKHPFVVEVHCVERHNGTPFIVQEYIDGQNLADWARKNRPCFQQIAKTMANVADALGYAHGHGHTHCDLKVANILMDSEGLPHVTDFGMSIHESVQALYQGMVFGTPATMAPEQVRGLSRRIDGRTDIWAMGVTLYQLLVRFKRSPFTADSTRELIVEITEHDPKPPRGVDHNVPQELERICLKCLSKRMADRYMTAYDLKEDLLDWLEEERSSHIPKTNISVPAADSSSGPATPLVVMPKGLRSFDADDADFFLELLPGLRDRDGLPESIRFWKKRIEETDPDETFSVGLVYGPSGCGKSSLLKAGLLPRLRDSVLTIHVEATAEDTEIQIMKEIRRRIPRLSTDTPLAEVFGELRLTSAGDTRKVLLVIDQFEQWLHAHADLTACQLVDALRQCEGGQLQAVLIVRDDFFASVHRLFQELESPLLEATNYALVDRFDKDHARKVLATFGVAYGKLGDDLLPEHNEFLAKAVNELAEDNRVTSVRLALFADMMKSRPWIATSLDDVERVGGVGVAFLEETLSARSAPPPIRVHAEAIRAVLTALLPDFHSDIRGAMQSADQLRELAGYADRSKDFRELIHILDNELRLITPADYDGLRPDSGGNLDSNYYQLTHDYLVPSLREWLTREQRETRRGRAELLLKERSVAWASRSENRNLPTPWEVITIFGLTRRARWSNLEHKMMRKATIIHSVRLSTASVLLLIAVVLIQHWYVNFLVASLGNSQGASSQALIEQLHGFPSFLVRTKLQRQLGKADVFQRLPLALAMAKYDNSSVKIVLNSVENDLVSASDVENVVKALENSRSDSLSAIRSRLPRLDRDKNWVSKSRMAILALYLNDTSIAENMLQVKETSSPRFENPLELVRRAFTSLEDETPFQRGIATPQLTRAQAYYHLDKPHEIEDLDEIRDYSIGTEVLRTLCLARKGLSDNANKAVERLMETEEERADYARIMTLAWLGQYDDAVRELENLIPSAKSRSGIYLYNTACTAAQLTRVCSDDEPGERERLRELAIELMREYLCGELADPANIDIDPDLSSLHKEATFQQLLAIVNSRQIDQRAQFISEFARWCRDVDIGILAEISSGVKNPNVRTGIALAIGSIKRPGARSKEEWKKVLKSWHRSPDGATHSASGWALRQWSLDPLDKPTDRPSRTASYWHTPQHITMLKVSPGSVFGRLLRTGRNNRQRIDVHEDFWICDREVSIAQFKQFVQDRDYDGLKARKWAVAFGATDQLAREDYPMQKVSWFHAVMFCNWLSHKHGLDKRFYRIVPQKGKSNASPHFIVTRERHGQGFRLPTKDEWEYACRAGTTSDYSCGNNNEVLMDYAVFAAIGPAPCASRMCNPWGIFDMHGNVAEWCWDSRRLKLNCGGSWEDYNADITSWSDDLDEPNTTEMRLGFRVALTLSQKNREVVNRY